MPVNDIKDLKGKFSGRIWMVGNGPSLAQTPLHLLNGEHSFGMNAISMIYPKTTWRPSFYLCISSNSRWQERIPRFQESIDLGIPSFLRTDHRVRFKHKGNFYLINTPENRDSKTGELIARWSLECDREVVRYATSMYVAAQIAVYMGFTKLILLGCDLGWKLMHNNREDPNHFDPLYSEHTTIFNEKRVERVNREMIRAHELMAEYGEAYGFEIFNATLGGELEVHPRVDMLTVLESERV